MRPAIIQGAPLQHAARPWRKCLRTAQRGNVIRRGSALARRSIHHQQAAIRLFQSVAGAARNGGKRDLPNLVRIGAVPQCHFDRRAAPFRLQRR
ncbi:hypothetical protein SDC9_141533 [bioreactor metagenome]|uniref:Uncharacterized protein n=1 Tax=bioreactor metagenome TaxID=1076179 RepID=A0A645DYC8_9ZZZZ